MGGNTFSSGTTFSGFTATGNSQEFYDTAKHILHIDTTGSGIENMTITLTGVSGATLNASNFVWS